VSICLVSICPHTVSLLHASNYTALNYVQNTVRTKKAINARLFTRWQTAILQPWFNDFIGRFSRATKPRPQKLADFVDRLTSALVQSFGVVVRSAVISIEEASRKLRHYRPIGYALSHAIYSSLNTTCSAIRPAKINTQTLQLLR